MRIERVLGMIVVNGMNGASKQEKALRLADAGFSRVEIADVLGTTVCTVGLQLYRTGWRRRNAAARNSSSVRARARSLPRRRRAR